MESESQTHPLDISLVIPAYNEEAYLPRLLDTVDEARAHYSGGPSAIEVIVADNASTDATPDLARKHGCVVVRVETRAIAAARNGGAKVAKGAILAFVDADTQIHPDTFNSVRRAIESGKFIAGATGVKMERLSPGIACAYALMVPLALLMKLDTGVVFCRRTDFERIGGYNEERLYAEDVQFLLDLRRLGKRRGQGLVRLTSAKAITSTRKFDLHGEWHYVKMILTFPFMHLFFHRRMEKFAKEYWYNGRQG
ncbi:MAG: glycosyltransferase [Candidatus Hydrogenedentes bacterium]|nr:glycosyltransferase [Candidatus Hydrogenedentota bacterium]